MWMILGRVRFRWVLPLLLMGINLAIAAACGVEQRRARAAGPGPAEDSGSDESAETVTFSPGPPPIGRFTKAALLCNLPAWFLGDILHLLFRVKSEASAIALGALMVPCVWYPIGRWVDEHIGNRYRTRRAGRFEWLRKFLLRALAVLYLLTAVLTLTPAYHHRTPDTRFMACVLLLWCGGYFAAAIWGERRDRRLAGLPNRDVHSPRPAG